MDGRPNGEWPPPEGGLSPALAVPLEADVPLPEIHGDPRLRSINDTTGYNIEATDGPIGHVYDFLIDSDNWRIRYLIIDTRNWWPGKKVIIAPAWIDHVSWAGSEMVVELTRDLIRGSPEYDPSAAWNPAYGERLHDYYRHLRHRHRDEALAAGKGHRL